MSDIYIAKQSVGQFRLGEEIKGLNAERIEFLLAEGAIEKITSKSKPEPKVETKTDKPNTKKA